MWVLWEDTVSHFLSRKEEEKTSMIAFKGNVQLFFADWNWQDLAGTGWNTHSGPKKTLKS